MAIRLICSALTLFATGVPALAYGLGENFGQALFLQGLTIVAGYVPFLFCIVVVIRFLLRGRFRLALLLGSLTALVFVAYPLWDWRQYHQTRDKIMSGFVWPGQLDLQDKDILYIRVGTFPGCRRSCVVLGREAVPASLHVVHFDAQGTEAFYDALTRPLDLTNLQLINISPDPEEYRGIRETSLEEGRGPDFDYVILDGLSDEIVPAIAPWYDDVDLPADALMSNLIIAAVQDPTRFDLGAIAPDLFVPYHRGRFQTVPLNPAVTRFDQIHQRTKFNHDLAPIVCPGFSGEALDDCRRDL